MGRFFVINVQVVKVCGPPTVSGKAKAKVVFLGLHEQVAVQSAAGVECLATQSHPTTHEDVPEGAAFMAAVG